MSDIYDAVQSFMWYLGNLGWTEGVILTAAVAIVIILIMRRLLNPSP